MYALDSLFFSSAIAGKVIRSLWLKSLLRLEHFLLILPPPFRPLKTKCHFFIPQGMTLYGGNLTPFSKGGHYIL